MPRLAVPPLYAFAKQTGMTFAFLQDDRLLYAGQPITMVVANTREQAVGAALAGSELAFGMNRHEAA
jgi:CO/xanthine dehydrogenase Mo-binding subunit